MSVIFEADQYYFLFISSLFIEDKTSGILLSKFELSLSVLLLFKSNIQVRIR